MSDVSPLSERLVNGESNIDAAVTATGAVSGDRGGTRGSWSCVDISSGGGGGGGSGGESVSSVAFSDEGDGNDTNSGNGGRRDHVATIITGGVNAINAISNDSRDVTLFDACGSTPVSFCRETTVSRICGGGCRCCSSYVTNVSFPAKTCASNGDDNGDDAVAAVTANYRGFAPSSIETTTTPPDAGSVDATTVGRSISNNNSGSTAIAAVVIVDDVSSLFLDQDKDDNSGKNGENRHHSLNRGNMVAAMNEHLSSTATTTTTSSLLAVNAIRNTVPISSSPAIMTTTTTPASGNTNNNNNNSSSSSNSSNSSSNNNNNHHHHHHHPTSAMTMSNATIGSGANNNSSNSCNSMRNQEFQEMDGDDGNATTTTTTAAAGILNFPCDFDHMYASMTDGGAPAAAATATATAVLGVSPLRGNEPRQNDFTEVKHLKELLLLHLDLIQQQSEQIVTKDKLLAALRQENETLKLRLERMERRVNLQKLKSECNENSTGTEGHHLGTCSPTSLNLVNVPSTSELHRSVQCEGGNTLHESFKIRLNTSGGITTVKQEPHQHDQSNHEIKQEINNETTRFEWEEKKKRRSDPTGCVSTGSKKKRGLSCSSSISVDASSSVQDKVLLSQTLHEAGKKGDRKIKSLMKKESFLTTEEHYYTAVGDPNYTLSLKSSPVETDSCLEVPNWRVKIYTSCYTMEGTENLDDEIFNKRHLKLENDERRRKRWDVQRIREQRHIEKLKQRQERQNHQATCYNTNHTGPCPSSMEEETITSLWPDIEQIQSLQVDPHLPVTAFGAAIPNFTPSEFSLPWSNTTRIKCRRPKRSTSRRKSTGRRKI